MRALPFFLLLSMSTGLAVADQAKKPPAPASVPVTLVPCLPDGGGAQIASLKGDPVVCWDGGCMKLVPGASAEMVAPPPATPSWLGARAEVRDEGGKASVCLAGVCKPVGKKLVAAIAAERKSAGEDKRAPTLEATADGKAVLVGSEAWSVGGDKLLVFKKPGSYKADEDTPEIVGVQIAGNLMLVSWANCAGPCTRGQFVDSGGKNRGKDFDGGGQMFQLDAKRFVVMSEYAEIQVFDLAGKPLDALPLLVDPGSAYDAIALDEGTIGVLREEMHGGHRLMVVSAYEDVGLRLSSERFLPACQP